MESFPDLSTCRQKDPAIPFVQFSNGEFKEFADSWGRALIINTVGITRSIWDIQKHLRGLWKIKNPIEVSVLGKGLYVLSMASVDDYLVALAGGIGSSLIIIS